MDFWEIHASLRKIKRVRKEEIGLIDDIIDNVEDQMLNWYGSRCEKYATDRSVQELNENESYIARHGMLFFLTCMYRIKIQKDNSDPSDDELIGTPGSTNKNDRKFRGGN